ncbi:hypothetical protein E2P86_08965 [Sphingobacterium psychroaquaticum]|uniref:hypothetical protein n=1 Tax=Sphingobacterium psychroaquaticum TaxID=561061 RepID=UPI00106A78FA|nr:hypothetical protein [Sphingobacterium psychroaquaticum]QBQ41279.1 hypothetical protein E2P86_08965 [Sphingobacterium psychroaquaticum]
MIELEDIITKLSISIKEIDNIIDKDISSLPKGVEILLVPTTYIEANSKRKIYPHGKHVGYLLMVNKDEFIPKK